MPLDRTIIQPCDHCGREFWSERYRARRFCSPACSYAGRKRPPEDRFWEKVDRSGGPGACWLWQAGVFVSGDGYGAFTIAEGVPTARAHRYAWELLRGPIPPGMEVCHNCPAGDNPRCVNPAHLFLGTQADNMRDMDRKGRRVNGAHAHGTAHPLAKLDPDKVRAIRAALAAGEKIGTLARRYGVDWNAIAFIARGKTWGHVA